VQGNSDSSPTHDITLQLNFYSIAAFSALAGMFSKQATDKFGEVFTAIFAMQKEVERKGALDAADVTVTPKQLTVGKPQSLTVVGKGFSNDTTATIGGDKRTFVASGETQGTVTTEAKDVAQAGTLELTIINRGKTYKIKIPVVAPGENAADGIPVISSTAPEPLTKAGARSLDVIGERLSGGSATINGEARNVTPVDDTKISIALDDKDFATIPGSMILVVTTPKGNVERTINIPS
jgi:hypothetical protein